MAVETWWRNPHHYIKEVAEVRHPLIAFHRGVAVKQHIDPVKFCDLYLRDQDWRCMMVGQQGTIEYRKGDKVGKPTAVYPTWTYGEPIHVLEDYLKMNVGMIEGLCRESDIPWDERPVLGQDHRVVIVGLPRLGTGPGRRIIRVLAELQEENPDATIHLNGLYSMRVSFSGSFKSVDSDPRTSAAKGKVYLGSGKEMRHERTVEHAKWVHLNGMSLGDLTVPRNRCIFNMKTALWAAEHFANEFEFRVRPLKGEEPDIESPDDEVQPATRKTKTAGVGARQGDKMLCNVCTLQTTCTYFRQGAVCSVPGSEPVELAKFFKTRDSDRIIEGLGTLLAAQANRLKRGVEDEEVSEELDPEVTKIINGLFDRGVQLAKLVDPSLNSPKSTTQVGIIVGNGPQASVKSLTAAVVAELEAKGVPRDKITPDMVMNLVGQPDEDSRRQAITATVEAERAVDSEGR